MMKASKTALAIATSAALAATLGLAACGSSPSQSSSSASSSASSTASATQSSTSSSSSSSSTSSSAATSSSSTAAQKSTVAEYDLTAAWTGMDGNVMAYYYEGSDTAAFLAYDSSSNTYERWVGQVTATPEGAGEIVDAETGAVLSYTVESAANDGTVEIKTGDGLAVSMSPSTIDEVGSVLDEISAYATKAGETSAAKTATELGGEFLIRANTEGLGQIALAQKGDAASYADSAFTHANAGDAITLAAKAGDGWKFVKWIRDGADFSTEAEIEATVSADAEYVAVFETA